MLSDPTLAAPQHSLAERLVMANESHWWVLKRLIHAFSVGGFLGFMLIFSVFFSVGMVLLALALECLWLSSRLGLNDSRLTEK